MHPLLSAAVTFLAGWTACSLLYIVLLLVDALASFSRIGTVRKATANLWGATKRRPLSQLQKLCPEPIVTGEGASAESAAALHRWLGLPVLTEGHGMQLRRSAHGPACLLLSVYAAFHILYYNSDTLTGPRQLPEYRYCMRKLPVTAGQTVTGSLLIYRQ